MTPVALWTGRLPGLRPLPRKRTLWLTGGIVLLGVAGVLGIFGPHGPWLGIAASLTAGCTILCHRWPTVLPWRLQAEELPQGADERAVIVEFREEGALMGWDVGILWFEEAGIGFVGKTVSFVVPRAIMQQVEEPRPLRTAFRSPQLAVKVFETTVGIIPVAKELNAAMTLARIEALPTAVTSETILPPNRLHPDLVVRGLAVRSRLPVLYGFFIAVGVMTLMTQTWIVTPTPETNAVAIVGTLVCLAVLTFGTVPPAPIRARLPRSPRSTKIEPM